MVVYQSLCFRLFKCGFNLGAPCLGVKQGMSTYVGSMTELSAPCLGCWVSCMVPVCITVRACNPGLYTGSEWVLRVQAQGKGISVFWI